MGRMWMVVVLAFVPAIASVQGPGPESGAATVFSGNASVLNLMSAEQFSSAGLSKLSPAERRALSEWVRTHSLHVAELARTAALNPERRPDSGS